MTTFVRQQLTDTQWLEALGIDPFWIVSEDTSENASVPLDVSTLDLPALDTAISECQRCKLGVHQTQKHPGKGNAQVSWMFVVEHPPGKDELVLLEAMLKALDIKGTQNVYLTSAIKCPVNRNSVPLGDSVDACRVFLQQEIACVQPKVMVMLGALAAQAALGEQRSLESWRGQSSVWQPEGWASPPIPVVVTLPLELLLMQPLEKKKVWQDLLQAESLINS